MTHPELDLPRDEERPPRETALPLAFLRRLTEVIGLPTPVASITATAFQPPGTTWQQTLEHEGAAHGLRLQPVVWPLREAFGAATPTSPLVSMRHDESGPCEWLALVGRAGNRALIVFEDGSSRWLSLDALQRWLGEPDDGAPRSWVVVESQFPSAMDLDSTKGPSPSPAGSPAHASPFQRLVDLLRPEQADLWAVLLFAALIGGLTLATPIAVQQLVNSIAFGGLIQPVVVLALLLFAVLAFSAVLSAVQAFVAELIQRRIFARVILDVAERLPRVHARAFDRHHGPELVNRVFDVVTVQKVGSLLLLDGTTVLLQTTVGLIVLSFYHPLMLAFSGLLIAGIIVVVLVMGRGAVRTAIAESKAKYEVVGWLEELALHASTFRDADQRSYARDRADALASTYIGARSGHYRIVLRQMIGALVLQVLANSALLALGGVLVVQGQLTLGQLVASELIITVIVAAVAKFGKQLERFYDLLAAMDKLSTLIDLPLEREDGSDVLPHGGPATVELSGVAFGYGPNRVFDDLDLRIEAGERLAIEGAMGTGKSALLDLLFGLRQPGAGSITIDGQDYRDIRLESLRSQVALVREPEIFSGTLRENIRVGRHQFSSEDVRRALDAVGLLEEISTLPDGIETRLAPGGRPLSQVQASRLALARAILARPRLLLVDRALEDLDPNARERICEMLFDARAPWTLLVV
ncbi:MAG TPA: ABC transporter ATP-binding protein, partial [Myxococcota bacterium]|nr:ABC transporter ATP-binding protein [Myxococcota bacterium]